MFFMQLDSAAGATTAIYQIELFFSDGTSYRRDYHVNSDAPNQANAQFNSWQWQNFGDLGVTPADFPSIASTVRANPSAGFSTMTLTFPTYSGTSSVAHGLNSAPHFWVMKDRDSQDGWYFGHKSLGAGHYVRLESNGNKLSSQYLWDNKLPDADVIYNNGTSMTGSGSYLMLAWAPVDGYSAMGSYQGTGAAASAAFVYTGMRPRWIMVKNVDTGDSSTDWLIYDTARSTTNPVDDQLYPNRHIAEAAASTHAFDILSNGFRVRCCLNSST